LESNWKLIERSSKDHERSKVTKGPGANRRHAMNAIEAPPQMLRLCAACASFMPNARAETADQFRGKGVP
jgi:hypothetical protein